MNAKMSKSSTAVAIEGLLKNDRLNQFLLSLVLLLCLFSTTAKADISFQTIDPPIDPSSETLLNVVGVSGNELVGNITYFGHSFGTIFDSTNATTFHVPNAIYGAFIAAAQGNYIMGDYTDNYVNTLGFIYNGTSFSSLEVPGNSYNGGNTYTQVTGMQGTNFIGNYTEDYHGTQHGFVYNGSIFTTITDPDAPSDTYLTGSQGSNLIGYYNSADGGTHGFIYNGSTYTTFDDPVALTSTNRLVYSIISGSTGNYLFGSYNYNGVENAWLYDGSTFTTLDDPNGVDGTYITGSLDGTNLVGYYTDASGINHGFIAYGAVPEPSSIALFGLGALALIVAHRRKAD